MNDNVPNNEISQMVILKTVAKKKIKKITSKIYIDKWAIYEKIHTRQSINCMTNDSGIPSQPRSISINVIFFDRNTLHV